MNANSNQHRIRALAYIYNHIWIFNRLIKQAGDTLQREHKQLGGEFKHTQRHAHVMHTRARLHTLKMRIWLKATLRILHGTTKLLHCKYLLCFVHALWSGRQESHWGLLTVKHTLFFTDTMHNSLCASFRGLNLNMCERRNRKQRRLFSTEI